jgi:hypothetical protein
MAFTGVAMDAYNASKRQQNAFRKSVAKVKN